MTSKSFVLTSLADNPEYFEEILALIEEEFHYAENQHYEKDFALLMDPSNFENCYFYLDEQSNTVAAHLAVCPRRAIKKSALLEVALIGAIATRREYRGQNLFRNLLTHALERHQGSTGLFMLWSEITGLYEKFQFHLSGGSLESGAAPFTAESKPAGFARTKFTHLSNDDFERVRHLYSSFNERYFFTMHRSSREWDIIRSMDSIDVFIKRNAENEIIQYFCINKGKDLGNIIHEIGCLADYYLPLTTALRNFKLWLPESEQSLTVSKQIFFTAFMKLGDLTKLNEFLSNVTNDRLKITAINEGNVDFSFDDEKHQCSEKYFLQYVFGPRPLKEFEPFQLSLYVTGTDSV